MRTRAVSPRQRRKVEMLVNLRVSQMGEVSRNNIVELVNMFHWFCVLSSLVATVSALPAFESEIVKKIFQQDPSFCFRPFEAADCNRWNETEFEPNKTLAFLFTKKNPTNPEFLHLCGGHLPKNTNFGPEHKTEIFIHGYLDGVCRSAWMREMRKELFKRGSYNVILVDWTWGNGPNYTESAENTYRVGRQIAVLLQNIMAESGALPENFHLIGHSLGAHAAGFAGKIVPGLRRITALDPALNPFQNRSTSERLHQSDAGLVDVIHTNGGTKVGEVLGDINPLGHADFYPNGGTQQHSCRQHIIKSYLALDFLYATISLVPRICSHMHAVQYYKVSINPKRCELVGALCPDYETYAAGQCPPCGDQSGNNCAIMGMNYEDNPGPRIAEGQYRKFYLNTTIGYPYCDN
ncbi:hypothetical protein JTE90_019375 [Oedothorax gibbosus]|uniref:Lipase domain-containing protein n=1 Tax=Oedothorax gibbosus TaxID=931172 RepID=A0AAV6TYP4_9ARAC|nr:hypothetical protein JTE90_019375 [Oedothorax gibbosus]